MRFFEVKAGLVSSGIFLLTLVSVVITNCTFLLIYSWTSTSALANPKTGWTAIKNFINIIFNNKHVVYASTTDASGNYGLMNFGIFSN
jgi:alpha-N-arabinofuranosidase